MAKYKSFVITADVFIYAKNEKEAKSLWENQLTFSHHDGNIGEYSNVEPYAKQTKIKKIKEVK